jgi:predicted extracellular nuclease
MPARITPGTNLPIPQIQGSGSLSPYRGDTVTTQGVITAVQRTGKNTGFFMQDPRGDGNPATSDGIYVSTAALSEAARSKLDVGNQVTVTGEVSEANSFTSLLATARGVTALRGSKRFDPTQLPSAEQIELPRSVRAIPAFLEARESMLVSLPQSMVLSPTDRFSTYPVVSVASHGARRAFDPVEAQRSINVSGRLGPKAQLITGDRVEGIHGPLAAAYGTFEIQQTRYYSRITRSPHPPLQWGDIDGDDVITPRDEQVIARRAGQAAHGPQDPADLDADGMITKADGEAARLRAAQRTGAPSFSLATLNAENFFDSTDAPPPIDDDVPSENEYNAKLARIAGAIRDKLMLPDMVALQEVENTKVLDDLIARPELQAMDYRYVLLPTTGHRSINPALLYRADRVTVDNARQLQKIVPIDDAVNEPMSASDPNATNGPLFARQPLVVDVSVRGDDPGQRSEFTMVVNHLISKFSPRGEPTDPIRINQARYLNEWVTNQRAALPNREIIVMGDLNDRPDSEALRALRGSDASPALIDALAGVPKAERWTYNYKGLSEQIDHILVTPGMVGQIERAGVRHFNADLPESNALGSGAVRASDHDAPYVWFRFPEAGAREAARGASLLAA